MFDIVIVGAGPAGLTAALYALRTSKSVLLLEKKTVGGQILNSPKIQNYPGFSSISGKDFIKALYKQVIDLGAQVELEEVTSIRNEGDMKIVVTNKGEYETRTVIIASGASPKKLGVAGEELFSGDGVSYCAICDGAHYKKKKAVVVGGGNSGILDALQLSEYCSKVYIVQNQDHLTAEERWTQILLSRQNVQVIYNTVVESIEKSGAFTVHLINQETNESSAIHVDGIFVAVGQEPCNEPFENVVDLDRNGYVVSGEECLTREEGIFVAGDCRTKNIRQITTATSDGTVAAMMAIQYLERYF